VPQNRFGESGLLILASRGSRLETHAKVADLKIGDYTKIGRAACLRRQALQKIQNRKRRNGHGYSDFCDRT